MYVPLFQWWRVGCSGLVLGPAPGLEPKPHTLADVFLPFFGEHDLDPLSSFYSYRITQLSPSSSAKFLLGGTTTKDYVYFLLICKLRLILMIISKTYLWD